MGVVPIRHAADGMPEDLYRRFWHVFVVVSRGSFSKILQDPELLLARFNVLLWLDASQLAQHLKLETVCWGMSFHRQTLVHQAEASPA